MRRSNFSALPVASILMSFVSRVWVSFYFRFRDTPKVIFDSGQMTVLPDLALRPTHHSTHCSTVKSRVFKRFRSHKCEQQSVLSTLLFLSSLSSILALGGVLPSYFCLPIGKEELSALTRMTFRFSTDQEIHSLAANRTKSSR